MTNELERVLVRMLTDREFLERFKRGDVDVTKEFSLTAAEKATLKGLGALNAGQGIDTIVRASSEAMVRLLPSLKQLGSIEAIGSVDRVAPKLERVAPKLERVAPKLERVAPKLERVAPKLERVAPKLERVAPKLERVASKLERVAPKVERLSEKQKRQGSPRAK